MLSGLYLQSVDWENPLSEVAEEANASKGALIYEDYFEVGDELEDFMFSQLRTCDMCVLKPGPTKLQRLGGFYSVFGTLF